MSYRTATSTMQNGPYGEEPAPVSSLGCLSSDAAGERTDVFRCRAIVRCVKEATP